MSLAVDYGSVPADAPLRPVLRRVHLPLVQVFAAFDEPTMSHDRAHQFYRTTQNRPMGPTAKWVELSPTQREAWTRAARVGACEVFNTALSVLACAQRHGARKRVPPGALAEPLHPACAGCAVGRAHAEALGLRVSAAQFRRARVAGRLEFVLASPESLRSEKPKAEPKVREKCLAREGCSRARKPSSPRGWCAMHEACRANKEARAKAREERAKERESWPKCSRCEKRPRARMNANSFDHGVPPEVTRSLCSECRGVVVRKYRRDRGMTDAG